MQQTTPYYALQLLHSIQQLIASEKSQLISRLSFQNFLATTYPIDFQYTQQHLLPYWNPIRLGDSEDLTDHTGITPYIIASMTHICAKSTLSTGI